MKYLWQQHSYPEQTMGHSPVFLVLLLKSLGIIDGDTKYLDDEVMDYVFRPQKLTVQQLH